MARDTMTARLGLEAEYATIQAIRHSLANETLQAELVSRIRETVAAYLGGQIEGTFAMTVRLKVSPVPKTRRGPRAVLPKVADGVLSWFDADEKITNIVGPVGSVAYVTWLAQDWSRSFRYESQFGSFTAIKEKRGGRLVWYAHRRQGGRLKRVYLGQSENLTAAKLAQAARKLNASQALNLTEQ